MKQFILLLLLIILSHTQGTGQGAATDAHDIPAGEINRRIKLVADRIMFGTIPEMSSDFILADISFKPEFKRRFTDFSGDISGRYFDVFSAYPAENNPISVSVLMNEALRYQYPDGRKMQAALYYGPYLMSVDSNFQPFFDAEPSLSNYIAIDDELEFAPELAPEGSNLKNTYMVIQHAHTDMFGKYPVVMRPICETTWQPPCNVRV